MMISYHFFDRHGGVSDGRFASLNVSYGTGDAAARIEENRARVRHRVGTGRLISARQVHGDQVWVDKGEGEGSFEVDGCDALISDRPGSALMIQQADCQAVLLHDPVRRTIAAIHNGWRGSVADIIGTTISTMHDRHGTCPADLQAWLSPSLGPCCAEFVNHRTELPVDFLRFSTGENHFDFWRISVDQLRRAGVNPAAIHPPTVCTCCTADYFSYRRAVREGNPVCGRHASVICLAAG